MRGQARRARVQWWAIHRADRAARGQGTWGRAAEAPDAANGPQVARQARRQQTTGAVPPATEGAEPLAAGLDPAKPKPKGK